MHVDEETEEEEKGDGGHEQSNESIGRDRDTMRSPGMKDENLINPLFVVGSVHDKSDCVSFGLFEVRIINK